ncbi:LacI family DNA-binding transcriptional regulator [Jiulongibacter sp. NS-SX5]|uniref:LacI family DNA-binding transcriptional regulator n=1 Tax=Jiulongibacter sp. NS-SX5 TaxID=3463854 RepID=UPI0040583C5F
MQTITIKDIAKALNLSTSTVSRAIRGSYEISESTKQMVLDYVEKVNYRPNPIALSLRENKSRSIGVIVPEIANNFFSNAINGMEAVAQKRGYRVMIFQSNESADKEKASLEHVINRKLDGVIISLSGHTTDFKLFQQLIDEDFPMVFFDRVPDRVKANKVVADNFQGAFDATEHMILAGRKRIGHITSPPVLSITKERLAGYKAALEHYNIPYEEDLVMFTDFNYEILEDKLKQFMVEKKPDALFTASDRLALKCFEAANSLEIKIPDDIFFIGFTNLNVAHLLNPALSTVVQPAYDLGSEAARILLDNIENKKGLKGYQTLELPTILQVRKSTTLN